MEAGRGAVLTRERPEEGRPAQSAVARHLQLGLEGPGGAMGALGSRLSVRPPASQGRGAAEREWTQTQSPVPARIHLLPLEAHRALAAPHAQAKHIKGEKADSGELGLLAWCSPGGG